MAIVDGLEGVSWNRWRQSTNHPIWASPIKNAEGPTTGPIGGSRYSHHRLPTCGLSPQAEPPTGWAQVRGAVGRAASRKTRPVICPVTGGYPLHPSCPVAPVEAAPSRTPRMILLASAALKIPSGSTTPDRRLWIAGSRAARGTGSIERTPRSPDGMPRQHPEEHFGRGPVEISLISAVRTHALCVHTQECFGRRHRRAGRLEAAAHEPHLVAHTLHTHAYAALIRPRDKHPRNSRLRRAPE